MQFLCVGRSEMMVQGTSDPKQYISTVKQGIEQFKADERTQAMYGLAGEPAIALMVNVDSSAELDQYLSLNPISGSTYWEVHTLTSADEVSNTLNMLEEKIDQWMQAA